jgi:hypothetical protein
MPRFASAHQIFSRPPPCSLFDQSVRVSCLCERETHKEPGVSNIPRFYMHCLIIFHAINACYKKLVPMEKDDRHCTEERSYLVKKAIYCRLFGSRNGRVTRSTVTLCYSDYHHDLERYVFCSPLYRILKRPITSLCSGY